VEVPVQCDQPITPYDRIARLLDNTAETEFDPAWPITMGAYPEEAVYVLVLVAVEERTHVQPLVCQTAPFGDRYGQQQTTRSAVAVHEWMNRFKVIMNEQRVDERIERGRSVQVPLEMVQRFAQARLEAERRCLGANAGM
jgi:hypothetical protein